MKMKSFALLAMPALLAVSFVSIAPAFADDSVDAMNNNSSLQTLADASTQNQDNNGTDTNNNSMNNNNSDNNSDNNSNNNSTNDEGSPDTPSSTGDDDY